MKISNKKVLITGASSGIGAAIAKAMIRAGAARVLLLARSEEGLRKVAGEIEANGGKARIYKVDLSNSEAVENVAQRILSEVGAPDILINLRCWCCARGWGISCCFAGSCGPPNLTD